MITRLVLSTGTVLSPLAAGIVFWLTGSGSFRDMAATALLIATLCLCNVASFVALAAQNYQGLAYVRLSNGVVTGVAQIIGCLVLPEVWVLVATYAIGNLVAATVVTPSLIRMRRSRDADSVGTVFREERLGRFAGSVGTSAVMSNLGLALPLVGISALFGAPAGGAFYLARRLLMIPTQLVATSVSEVSYALVARETPDRIAALMSAWLRKAKVVAVVLLLVGFAMAPVVSLLVGPGYPHIAWMVVLLTPTAVAQMVATSFSNILLALHMELVRLLWNVGRLAGLLLIFVWASQTEADLLTAIAVFAAYTVVAYSLLLALTLRGVNARRRAA